MNAFIGASLGLRFFSRDWVRYAFEYALQHHDRLLIVIADELWLYTRLINQESKPVFELSDAVVRMARMRDEMTRMFEAFRAGLSAADAKRIDITGWSTYSDAQYAHLLRMLRSASAYLTEFSASVGAAAEKHVSKIEGPEASTLCGALAASRDFVLDEMAMCLRITELAGFSAEYYPGDDLSVLIDLYSGRFASEGLTVESLIGKLGQRHFTNLKIPITALPVE